MEKENLENKSAKKVLAKKVEAIDFDSLPDFVVIVAVKENKSVEVGVEVSVTKETAINLINRGLFQLK